MNYKQYQMSNYNLHIIEMDKFKTVRVQINLKKTMKKEEMTIRNTLIDMLVTTSKAYPTKREVVIETENLYNISVNGKAIRSGNYDILSFRTNFLNEHYTELGMHQKSIFFLLDLLTHPNVENDAFDPISLQIVKKGIEEEIKSCFDDPGYYSTMRLYEEMDSESTLSYHSCGYLEDLENITPEALYTFYKQLMEDLEVDIFVVGNVDAEAIKEIFASYPLPFKKKTFDLPHIIVGQPKEKVHIVKEEKAVTQSVLKMGFNIEEMTPFERQYVMHVYDFILGGGENSILFQEVREKNSLCYVVSSSYSALHHVMVVKAGIDAKNYEKTVSIIKEQVEALEKGEFDEAEIEKAKVTYKNSCKEILDSQASLINVYLSSIYLGSDTLDERIKNIELVTKDMIIELAKKIHLNTIFLLEGNENCGKEDI